MDESTKGKFEITSKQASLIKGNYFSSSFFFFFAYLLFFHIFNFRMI
jgi:hypothetical protein